MFRSLHSGFLLSRSGLAVAKMSGHVIVLHGLGLNKYWMAGFAYSLKRQGFTVHNISYPSRNHTLEQIVDQHIEPLIQSLPTEKISFAVHSMGGILVRFYAHKYGAARIGRVVMLGTPNQGSETADFISNWRLFRWIFAGSAMELITGEKGISACLGAVPFECGVIAGTNRWIHFPVGWIIKKLPLPHDGLVSVHSTKVDGMKDHITFWSDHSMMVWNAKIWRQAAYFLKNGRFQRDVTSGRQN